MKKESYIIIALLIMFSYQSCNNEEDPTSSQVKVSFNLSASDVTNGGRVNANNLADATSVVLSIETNTGASVLLHHSIKLLNFGGEYVTESIELIPGSYVITDFMIVNDSSTVEYATPKLGSSLSSVVKHPLPYCFTTAHDKLININIEVVPVDAHAPEEFGYAAFRITAIRPIYVVVFGQKSTPQLINCRAYILKDGDTLKTFHLDAKVNSISFTLDPIETYKIVIIKDGYTRFVKTFVYNNLITELKGLPLKVYLQPALTLWVGKRDRLSSGEFTFNLLTLSDADLSIDWGDDQEESSIRAHTDDLINLDHLYPYTPARYFITVSGDIDKITECTSNPMEIEFLKCDFTNLQELKLVNFFITGPKILDIHANKKIESIVFGGDSLLLPNEHQLKTVILYGQKLATSLDYIIHNVYKNARTKNLFFGSFYYSMSPTGDEQIGLGIPTTESMSELRALMESFNWNVLPYPFS